MFIINDDKSIYITRGDFAAFTFRVDEDDSGAAHIFQPGDVVRFKVFEKKGCDAVVLQKDFPITEECDSVEIRLMGSETKIGGIIHKPEDYWYEVELNPDTYPQTIIGYDEDGAKTFRLLPEGKDLEPDEDEEQQGTAVYERVLALVGTMSEHGRQAAEDSKAAKEAAAAAEAIAQSIEAARQNGEFTPRVGENGNWWIGETDTGVFAKPGDVVDGKYNAGDPEYPLTFHGSAENPTYNGIEMLKVQTGTYKGTGTSGASAKNKITFNFTPKMVIVYESAAVISGEGARYMIAMYGTDAGNSNSGGDTTQVQNTAYMSAMKFTWTSTSLTWWQDLDTSNSYSRNQLNASGKTYKWIAIG